MQTREWLSPVDKSDWGSGPWQMEPDKAQWRDPATGLPCLIKRNCLVTGALCGYVGITKEHPDFGKGYDGIEVEVHGGLTFADFCTPGTPETEVDRICHVPDPGEDDHVWWLGFDCSHSDDLAPAMEARMRRSPLGATAFPPGREPTYKPIAYVQEQVRALAAQLAARK